jgi:GH25 family lysozyme M1 (1,4-beta-N-acetylmuramidase)
MRQGILDVLQAYGMVSGPDVSSVQAGLTPAHWAACAQDNAFAIIKCGNGNDGSDPTYEHNVVSARNAGLVVGTYHFVYVLPDKAGHPGRSPEEQADAHWFNAMWQHGDMIPWADFEWPYPQDWDKWELPQDGRSDWIADFILRYTSHYAEISGNPIGIYSYPDWIARAGLANVDRSGEIAALPFWKAGPYVHTPPNSMPEAVAPWTACDVYQWTNSKDGKLTTLPNGAPCDWNTCLGSTLQYLSVVLGT